MVQVTEQDLHAPTNEPMPMRVFLPAGIALLGPPIVWALHLNVSYFLVQPVCVMGGEIALHIASIAALGLMLIPLITSIRVLANYGIPFRDNLEGRDGWLAFVGLFGVAAVMLFGLGVVYQWAPMFVLDVCGVNAP